MHAQKLPWYAARQIKAEAVGGPRWLHLTPDQRLPTFIQSLQEKKVMKFLSLDGAHQDTIPTRDAAWSSPRLPHPCIFSCTPVLPSQITLPEQLLLNGLPHIPPRAGVSQKGLLEAAVSFL